VWFIIVMRVFYFKLLAYILSCGLSFILFAVKQFVLDGRKEFRKEWKYFKNSVGIVTG
jgi:hypothetical protein